MKTVGIVVFIFGQLILFTTHMSFQEKLGGAPNYQTIQISYEYAKTSYLGGFFTMLAGTIFFALGWLGDRLLREKGGKKKKKGDEERHEGPLAAPNSESKEWRL